MARVLQQFVGCILLKWQASVRDDSPEKIVPLKGQHENDAEQCQRRCSSQFSYPALVEKGTDLKIFNERGDSTLQLFCFLLFLMLSGNIHFNPSSLILLMFLAKTNISGSEGFFIIYFIISWCYADSIWKYFQPGKLSQAVTPSHCTAGARTSSMRATSHATC